MTDTAIRVEDLSKQYRIGGPQGRYKYKSLREELSKAAQAPFRRLASVIRGQASTVSNETIWALKDVSFEVKQGEVVGIIGRRLIALEGFRYPESNRDVFQVLGEEEVVPQELLPALLDMAHFRNLIVHDYAKIDDAKVYAILKKRLGNFDEYARAILAYLERRERG
jgi:hypothetical protein